MCGIIAIYQKDQKIADPDILRQMAETIRHRGPDDEGYFINANIGLYHKRLSVIDLTSGHQPMKDGELTIVVLILLILLEKASEKPVILKFELAL